MMIVALDLDLALVLHLFQLCTSTCSRFAIERFAKSKVTSLEDVTRYTSYMQCIYVKKEKIRLFFNGLIFFNLVL